MTKPLALYLIPFVCATVFLAACGEESYYITEMREHEKLCREAGGVYLPPQVYAHIEECWHKEKGTRMFPWLP